MTHPQSPASPLPEAAEPVATESGTFSDGYQRGFNRALELCMPYAATRRAIVRAAAALGEAA